MERPISDAFDTIMNLLRIAEQIITEAEREKAMKAARAIIPLIERR